jgi:hypothetical protein
VPRHGLDANSTSLTLEHKQGPHEASGIAKCLLGYWHFRCDPTASHGNFRLN